MAKQTHKPFDENTLIGIADADLLDNGTRHPNLTLLKLAGYFHDHGVNFELIEDANADISKYSKVFLARVFSFTHLPKFYTDCPAKQRNKLNDYPHYSEP